MILRHQTLIYKRLVSSKINLSIAFCILLSQGMSIENHKVTNGWLHKLVQNPSYISRFVSILDSKNAPYICSLAISTEQPCSSNHVEAVVATTRFHGDARKMRMIAASPTAV